MMIRIPVRQLIKIRVQSPLCRFRFNSRYFWRNGYNVGTRCFLGRVKEQHRQRQSVSLNWSPHFLSSRLLRFVCRLIRRTHWGTINLPVTFSIILRISARPFLSSRHRACLSSAHRSWNCIVKHSSVYLGRHRRFSGRLAPSSCEWG